MHLEFKDEDVWARFNQRVSKIKGSPLCEGRTQTNYQKKQTGRQTGTAKTTPVNEWKNQANTSAEIHTKTRDCGLFG
jgi:hypothetical protein